MLEREHRKIIKAGSVVFREGEPGDCAYVIERGRVEVFVLRNGRKILLATLSSGDIFGEMALINNGVRSATVVTAEQTELICISREVFQDKIARTDPIVALFLRTLLERFSEARERLLSLIGRTDHWARRDKTRHSPLYERDRETTVRTLNFEDDLEKAIRCNEFQLFYQPIVLSQNGLIAGFEALIRWNHPQRGLLPPTEFIGFAETSGKIVPIGAWIFDEACRALRSFKKGVAASTPFVSVNVSIQQFKDPHFVDHLSDTIRRWSIDPARIKLEITETLLMEDGQLAALTLANLKRLGVSLAIDDFGTGYSSFSYLHRFPLDSLKIDQSFVQSMPTNTKSAQIVRSLATLAHALNLDVIAEGVENVTQLRLLQEFDCDCIQGQLVSAPVPLNKAYALLEYNSALRACEE